MSPRRLGAGGLVRPRGSGGRPRWRVGGRARPLVAEGAGAGGAGGVGAEVELVGVEGRGGGAGGGRRRAVAGVGGVHGGRCRRSARWIGKGRRRLGAVASLLYLFV